MPSYTVSVVIEGVDLTDNILDLLFQELEDAVPSSVDGAVRVTAPVEAPDDRSAALALIDQLVAVMRDATPVRLDQDLVSIPDIAVRTARTRESIRLLVEGKRGPGQFPTAIGTVGDGIRVWPWSVVVSWFRQSLREDLGEHVVSPQTAALVDAYLGGKVRRPGSVAAARRPKQNAPKGKIQNRAAKKGARERRSA